MSHPLDFIPTSSRKKIFILLLALTFILVGIFGILDAPLRNPASPSGIVSFELAGTVEKANTIMESWDSRAQLFAAFGLGFDYLFLLVYGLTISLGVLMVASKHGGKFAEMGSYVGWGVLLAALFDAVENFALWRLLSGSATAFCPRVAAISATIKFFLLALGLGFALIGWLRKKK
ncbi:MAG: hypothetical protein HN390_10680 [Anaerolineae bacterium]|jgi:hypothetical protein|nr:hypothetical protein [Anaerolineae bacterium]MBT7191709.1 hypothetical protein [Anaerolineae bacterium]MBT7990211.1 hypothetical protein [Anaerolineae bacterium]